MSPCHAAHGDAPRLALTLVGSGEALMRLEKRLHCAAVGLGLALDLTVHKEGETLGIPHGVTPLVLYKGEVVWQGLPRTEEIEAWLRAALPRPGDAQQG